MSANRGQQKQLAKKKQKREAARRAGQTRAANAATNTASAALLKLAPSLPFGPAYMSRSWRLDDAGPTGFVSVVITRQLPDGNLLPAILLVDRACFGVKDAFVARPLSVLELNAQVARLGEHHPGGMEETSLLDAQSVVYHAIDFARTLDIEPHPDFPATVVGPRPEVLAAMPLVRGEVEIEAGEAADQERNEGDA